ncbi:pyridoxine biosynthesis protein [Exophiala xenobiotica]|nr:pyridoxine biosynthesis protein [Exophiala xenobiotica]
MAGRQSVRMLARQLTSSCSHPQPPTRRTFSSTSSYLAAHNFTMPAMSPTMTEGNISSWKVKEGDSFSSGDVLLEIETDKATMDVEAQDDGVMAKIFVQEGSKAVQVGTRIAVLADAGDDVSSLEIPADNSKPAESPADNVQGGKEDGNKYESSGIEKEIPGTPQNKRPAKDKPKTSPTGPGQNPKYPLYPSVIALIHENHMSDDDVLKISASGPNGRLLKGDVLAYLGTIESDYASKQSERIEHLAHLDLSNIKLGATPTKAAGTPPTTEAGSSVPELPKLSSLDTIPTTSRGTYLPQIDAFSLQSTRSSSSARRSTPIKKPDIIDILSGKAVPKRAAPLRPSSSSSLAASAGRSISTSTAEGALNTFSVTVPAGEEKRAKTFLERVKTVLQIEPGKLIL